MEEDHSLPRVDVTQKGLAKLTLCKTLFVHAQNGDIHVWQLTRGHVRILGIMDRDTLDLLEDPGIGLVEKAIEIMRTAAADQEDSSWFVPCKGRRCARRDRALLR